MRIEELGDSGIQEFGDWERQTHHRAPDIRGQQKPDDIRKFR
jgi:hypothetical protein